MNPTPLSCAALHMASSRLRGAGAARASNPAAVALCSVQFRSVDQSDAESQRGMIWWVAGLQTAATLLQASGFHIKGHAPSLDIMLKYRACLAPLRFGAGLKGKVVDAWQHGLPVCTTPVGAEGMMIDADEPSQV